MKALMLSTLLFFMIIVPNVLYSQQTDTFNTSKGKLVIHFFGHASLLFEFNKLHIYVDPYSKVADYSKIPKADLILVTHEHQDHFDPDALALLLKNNTQMIFTQECSNTGKYAGKAIVLNNGDKQVYKGIEIQATPTYNIMQKRSDGAPYHPKGRGNGYIILFGNKRVYIAGDTENIPEMKTFGKIDIAFLPMNLPYTMVPEQTADAARMVHPKILYPYHYGETDVNKLVELLKSDPEIKVRVREMK